MLADDEKMHHYIIDPNFSFQRLMTEVKGQAGAQ
jgi:hypothetical protein